MTAPILTINDLTASYQRKPVLWDVNLELPLGKIIGIIGPNGAGKSTLLKAIMELLPLDSGEVLLWGEPLREVRKKVSYVPQRESVDWDFPASVYDVAMMGRYAHLGLFRRPRAADKDLVMHCLERVGIATLAHRQIAQLSGGQQQRVFLARALAQEADLYLLDEPFSAVDMATEATLLDLFKEMGAQGKSIIVVHHDLQSVQQYFDWSVLLNVRVVAAGPTREVLTNALLQETYGSRLTLLTEATHQLHQQGAPPREQEPF